MITNEAELASKTDRRIRFWNARIYLLSAIYSLLKFNFPVIIISEARLNVHTKCQIWFNMFKLNLANLKTAHWSQFKEFSFFFFEKFILSILAFSKVFFMKNCIKKKRQIILRFEFNHLVFLLDSYVFYFLNDTFSLWQSNSLFIYHILFFSANFSQYAIF